MHNQHQQQLTSTWLNVVGAGIISGGLVSQLVALTSGASITACLAVILFCVAAGGGLHLLALRRMRSTPDQS
ncbi:hypothetical protein [Enterovirga sp. CN4-39]|uniref:hypothetical protein n=1 Tax=Enterovirga sp. CN4-39 TaxID=3400910 RepID=UPI003C0AA213